MAKVARSGALRKCSAQIDKGERAVASTAAIGRVRPSVK